MAPAGNFECLAAAIQGGADSVYFGVGKLNMRSHSANNFAPEDLAEVCRICREAGVKSYLTLNIVLYNDELETMKSLTGCDKNAVAILSAARQGVKVLAKMNEALEKSITDGVTKETNANVA